VAAASVSMSLLFPDVVAWAGDLNARMKGIANCTKAQVPAQLPVKFSSKFRSTTRHQLCPLRVWTGL
jgi:hypothetical protein